MIDQTNVFQLQRLYVGVTPGQDGQAPTMQVLARTAGVKPEQLSECWRLAQLVPPPAAQRTEAMPGSFGIFRGETADFIIAKAQPGPNGAPQFQYLLAPSQAMRALGGNVRFFEGYAKEPIPQFAAPRSDLPPFILDKPEVPDAETQTADLEALMDYCKFDLNVVSGLLAGVVEAMGVGVINAPLSLHDRLTFVQAIMTMLPIPARVAVTFATSVTDPAQANAQIKFFTADARPPNHLIFDWATGKLLTEAPDDVYAKYMLSQLRLDTSLVLQQTEKLARTSVWRAMRKDDMANALGWVARRASLDNLVLDGLPADRKMVAAVLREDPTLPDNLRIAYSRHLLKLSLVLDDPSDTDIVPQIASANREVAEAVYEQLRTSIESGEQVMPIYKMVERWLLTPPPGADVSRWRPLLGSAILAQTNKLVNGDAAELAKFLEQFLNAPPDLQLEQPMAQVIGLARRRGYTDAAVARVVVLLAMTYLSAGGLQRLLAEAPLIAQLPQPLRDTFPHLVSPRVQVAPMALLTNAAEAFGPEHQGILLGRLVEWAMFIQRYDLMDVEVLHGMVKLGASMQGRRFETLSVQLIEALTPIQVLKTLNPVAPQYLVELSMVYGRYTEAIRQLEIYQNTLYKGTGQEDLSEITRAVFRDVPLDATSINAALDAMQDSQLKTVARANAFIGALEGKDWAANMEQVAKKLTAIFFADPRLTALIGEEPVLRLLKANADRRDAMESVRLAGAMVEYALSLAPDKGPTLIQQVYPLINWSPEVNDGALEILRTYVRRAPQALARELPDIMGNRYGDGVKRSLDATYRLRLMLNGTDFLPFSEQVHLGTLLLIDMALVYNDPHDLPPIHKLRRTVEGMPGGLSDDERKRLSANLDAIGLSILKVVQIANKKKGRQEPEVTRTQLLKGQIPPSTGLDALTWIGGRIGEGQVFTLSLAHEAPPHMFGNRSVNTLLRETDMLLTLLNGLADAFPEKDTPVDLKLWSDEVNMLWNMLILYRQRQIQKPLAEDTQTMAQAIKVIGERGNERSFQNSGYGRQLQTGRAQPRNVIDALRWVSGYFGHEHN